MKLKFIQLCELFFPFLSFRFKVKVERTRQFLMNNILSVGIFGKKSQFEYLMVKLMNTFAGTPKQFSHFSFQFSDLQGKKGEN